MLADGRHVGDSFPWHDNGQNGDAYFETAVIGGTWVQRGASCPRSCRPSGSPPSSPPPTLTLDKYRHPQGVSVNTGDAGRDEHLRSADFFGVDQNPELRCESIEIEQVDEDTFEIEGDLTMNGVTKPITLKAEVHGTETDPWGNERVALEITGQLNRGAWNMTFNQALGSGNLLVGEKVKLLLDLAAVKQA